MKKILFVCTGNSCRSVMAEGLFKKMTASRAGEFSITSAGISAMDGSFATDETVRAMEEVDVDVSGHQSRRLTVPMVLSSDYIFVMETIHRDFILQTVPEAVDKVFLLNETGIPDPIHRSEGFYRETLKVIQNSLKKILEDL